MNLERAFSVLDCKQFDDEKRVIRGLATSPVPDRTGDIVDQYGAKYASTIPLFLYHDSRLVVGTVKLGAPTKEGIPFEATLPKIAEPGALQDRVNEAWQLVKYKLIAAVSIGFRAIEGKVEQIKGGGLKYLASEILELSLVPVPMQALATIQTLKSFDPQARSLLGISQVKQIEIDAQAATGQSRSDGDPPEAPPGVSGTQNQPAKSGLFSARTKGSTMKTLQERISAAEAHRAALMAQKSAIIEKPADGETFDDNEKETLRDITEEVKRIDDDLVILREHQAATLKSATAVSQEITTAAEGSQARAGAVQRAAAIVRPGALRNEEKGISFAKFAMAMYAGKGDVSSAKAFAEHAFAGDTRLQSVMKAAVAAGTTTSPTWAGNLVDYRMMTGEFVDFLRPRTLIGQFGANGVPSLRSAPFNVKIPGKTAAGTASWVGEGYMKPVTASGYEATELGWSKIAAISVISDEIARFSEPSIQTLVRDDLASAVIERMDVDFVLPSKAAGTGAAASPASVTNGVTAITSAGTDAESIRTDIAALWATADSINLPASGAVYMTNAKTARMLSMMHAPLGGREFPEVRINGGSIDGVPLLVSNYVPTGLFILAFADEIYLADDGLVNIDVTREATIYMDSAPNATAPTAAQLVSMFQTNQMAIRAERYVHWKKRRPQAVAYLSGVAWGT